MSVEKEKGGKPQRQPEKILDLEAARKDPAIADSMADKDFLAGVFGSDEARNFIT